MGKQLMMERTLTLEVHVRASASLKSLTTNVYWVSDIVHAIYHCIFSLVIKCGSMNDKLIIIII